MKAPIHARETERLEAVRETGLLDGATDRLQQAAIRLASEIAGTPIAAVSLVDRDRQWFSAIRGLDLRQTGRDEAFCAHAILADVPLLVPDALSDERFRDNPLVVGDPHIRFYAGVPLRVGDNLPVGTLCVIDYEPKAISPGQLEALETLGALVASELELLRLNRRLIRETDERRNLLERERSIAAAVPGALVELRIAEDGRRIEVTHASARLAAILGREIEPFPAPDDQEINMMDFVHPEDRELLREAFRTSGPAPERRSVEFRIRPGPRDEERWCEIDAVGSRGNGLATWHAFISDATERRRAARIAARLAAIVEHSSEAILSLSPDARIVSWNPAAARIFGITPEQTIGRSVDIIVPPERRAEYRERFAEVAAGRADSRTESTRLDGAGERRSVTTALSPLRDHSGRIVGVTEVMSDVTRRKEVESRLAESLRVVDDVSHEFRTPLSVIREFSSIVQDGIAGPTTELQREYLAIVQGAVTDLNCMVEDLLDSSRLRAGCLRVDRVPVAVPRLFESMRGALATKASLRSITLEIHEVPGLPPVFADEGKVRRVISNLMTNAIKFSPDSGVVTLSAEAGPRADEVTVSVRDRGPGLSRDDIDRIFGRFEQLSTARRPGATGFGLGLSIARELAWLNLGCLSVSSRKGEGATFSFTLPVANHHAVISHAHATIHSLASDQEPLAILRIDSEEPDRFDLLRDWASSSCFATDLVLPCDQGDGRGRSMHLIGRSRAPHSWLERIRGLHARHRSEDSESVPDATFQVVGSWPPGCDPSDWIHALGQPPAATAPEAAA